MPVEPSETREIMLFATKVAGYFLTFVGGIFSAGMIIASKAQKVFDRLDALEENQKGCPGKQFSSEGINGINRKLDFIIEQGLPDVHKRIDDVLLRGRDERDRKTKET